MGGTLDVFETAIAGAVLPQDDEETSLDTSSTDDDVNSEPTNDPDSE